MTLRLRRKRPITAWITTFGTKLNKLALGLMIGGSALISISDGMAQETGRTGGNQKSVRNTPPPVNARPLSNHADKARQRFVQQFQNSASTGVPTPADSKLTERIAGVEYIRETIKAVPTVRRTGFQAPTQERVASIPPAPFQTANKQSLPGSARQDAPAQEAPQPWQIPDVNQPANLTPPQRVASNPYPVIQPKQDIVPGRIPDHDDPQLPAPSGSFQDLPSRVDTPVQQQPSSVMIEPNRDDPVNDPFADRSPKFRPSRVRSYPTDPRMNPGPAPSRMQQPQNNFSRFQEPAQDPVSASSTFEEMSCEEFRKTMMGQHIREIDLNISPDGSQRNAPAAGVSRSWSDRYGNVLSTGKMVKLRHGYVYVDTGSGTVRVPLARLSDNDLVEVSRVWELPETCTLGNDPYLGRCWTPQTVTWKASAACHKPLYFEDIQLERYGHSAGPFRQPVRSTLHFFGSLVFQPYQMGYQSPTECRYALGYYRPGNCAPWLVDPIPISLSGAARQAVSTVGSAYLFWP